jgi:hypothetical protein
VQKIAPMEPAGGNPTWKLAADVATMFWMMPCGVWPHTVETKDAETKRRSITIQISGSNFYATHED